MSYPKYILLRKIPFPVFYLCFILCVLEGHSQTQYEWTWVNGNTTASWGIKGLASATNQPSPRSIYGCCKDYNGIIWVFGGKGNDVNNSFGNLGDLWKYDPKSNLWTWVSGSKDRTDDIISAYGTKGSASAENYPCCRYESALWADSKGNIWLFGGYGYDAKGNFGDLNDLWKYDPANDEWTWMNGSNICNNQTSTTAANGIESAYNQPYGLDRSDYGWATYWSSNSNMLSPQPGSTDYLWFLATYGPELWRYNTATNNWTFFGRGNYTGIYGTQGIPAPANAPGIRELAACATDNSGNLWLFGGFGHGTDASSSGLLNDLWKYNVTTDRWTYVNGSTTTEQLPIYGIQGYPAANNHPGARSSATICFDANGNLWLYGGSGVDAVANSGGENDLWKFDTSTKQWSWIADSKTSGQATVYGTEGVSSSDNHPGAGSNAGFSWYDNTSDSLWLFAPRSSNEVWGFTTGSVVPLNFLAFDAVQNNRSVILSWTTNLVVQDKITDLLF